MVKLRTLSLVLVALLLAAFAAHADVVLFEKGAPMEGKTSWSGDELTLNYKGAQLTFARDEVREVFEGDSAKSVEKKWRKWLLAEDRSDDDWDHYKKWCKENGVTAAEPGDGGDGEAQADAPAEVPEDGELVEEEKPAPKWPKLEPSELGGPGGKTSRGRGGPTKSGDYKTESGVPFRIMIGKVQRGMPLLLVFSGTEGRDMMSQNLGRYMGGAGIRNHIVVVMDGRGSTVEKATEVLTLIRRWYDVANDAQKILTESAGTGTGLTFGLRVAPEHFAGVWANDPVTVVTPEKDAEELGFKPFGGASAGAKAPGDVENAKQICAGMKEKSYRAGEPWIDPNFGHGTQAGLQEGLKFLANVRRKK